MNTVEQFNHECLVAEDGEKASWELYQKTPEVDVIISDWTMPSERGPEREPRPLTLLLMAY